MCACVSAYVRRARRRLFLSFFLRFRLALEGDSSFSRAWLASRAALCWLKWLGTWRASPPWDEKLAVQPPTTHCGGGGEDRVRGVGETGGTPSSDACVCM